MLQILQCYQIYMLIDAIYFVDLLLDLYMLLDAIDFVYRLENFKGKFQQVIPTMFLWQLVKTKINYHTIFADRGCMQPYITCLQPPQNDLKICPAALALILYHNKYLHSEQINIFQILSKGITTHFRSKKNLSLAQKLICANYQKRVGNPASSVS